MITQRTISDIRTATPNNVGDGFIGLNAFHPQGSRPFNPFLLLDHHGPMQVQPSEQPKGVDEHPHRGFETVTIVYEGAWNTVIRRGIMENSSLAMCNG